VANSYRHPPTLPHARRRRPQLPRHRRVDSRAMARPTDTPRRRSPTLTFRLSRVLSPSPQSFAFGASFRPTPRRPRRPRPPAQADQQPACRPPARPSASARIVQQLDPRCRRAPACRQLDPSAAARQGFSAIRKVTI